MTILMHCRVISKLSIMVTSAKVHIPSMDLEHVSPGTTCALAEQEDRRRFPLKTGNSYWSADRGCCQNKRYAHCLNWKCICFPKL